MSKTYRGESLVDKIFGKLKVIEFFPNDKHDAHWICECSCQKKTKKIIAGSDLKRGNIKSCGCITKEKYDLTGKIFGNWVVICIGTEKKSVNRNLLWLCECSCEKKTRKLVSSNSLKNGHSTSCGCLKGEKISKSHIVDLSDKIFGKLKVIEPTKDRFKRHVIWKCECSCIDKTICYIPSIYLTKGITQSCGCIISIGENKIKQILEDRKIKYKTQYTFKDLKSSKNGVLKFDFGILDNNNILIYLIEFDGEQHIKQAPFQTLEAFEQLQINDNLKNKYCINNNIPLIRIPHTKKNKIDINDLQINTSKYLVT